MPGLICMITSDPWGPVTVQGVASIAELNTRPAYHADVGARDLGQVLEFVRSRLPAADAAGQIRAGLAQATAAVASAFSAISATVVADGVEFASPAPPVTATTATKNDAAPHEASPLPVSEPTQHHGIMTARKPVRLRARGIVDVRGIRAKLNMTQDAFAGTFGFPVGSLRDWEQHRAEPDSAAATLLRVIDYSPDTVRQALSVRTTR